MGLILYLAIGALAGWIAGNLMRGGGFGVLGNIIVGILGGILGGFALGLLGFTSAGLLGSLITSVIGAVLLLFLVGLIKR